MIEKRHAIRNDDESIWVDFDGDVPRIGDHIHQDGDEYVVCKVLWFTHKWRKEPHPSVNQETVTISQARVYIK